MMKGEIIREMMMDVVVVVVFVFVGLEATWLAEWERRREKLWREVENDTIIFCLRKKIILICPSKPHHH